MKRSAVVFKVVLFAVVALSSCHPFGKLKKFNDGGIEVYYTSNVTENETDKFGHYMENEWPSRSKDNPMSFQLNKSGKTYIVKFVAKEEALARDDKEDVIGTFERLGGRWSREVFDGAKVEVHLCDEHLETQKVVPMKDE